MQSAREFVDEHRPAGGRRSSKRDLIVEVFLRQDGHLSAEALADLIRKADRRISRATVYRTLQWRVEAGSAGKGDFGGGKFDILEDSFKSPLDGKTMPTFEDEMRQEFAVGSHVVQRHDFIEGVRALIIDKDNAPKWNPASVEEVSEHLIDQIFAPLSADQQWEP